MSARAPSLAREALEGRLAVEPRGWGEGEGGIMDESPSGPQGGRAGGSQPACCLEEGGEIQIST